ncbi:mechanosensitive ion channel family protein [Coleofasciculus sp. FACHB-1120]|uniref:mechanosensitive ion channel family protein n=1 Tax=Coleofasciculus sp. FACHB-1120 TaxID=2692783 RepID=UPI00168935E5|nr:mechanosensitive ion channel family protein [Coleofasciculus sp. FACHB-1120]MBD2742112.1 mechanosensitive ion channel family protein [Coleofasciculus sp. FACHB-1120]
MKQWIVPIAFILSGFLVGIIFDKFFLPRLKRIAVKTRLPGNEIVFHSLRGIPKIWFIVAGFYGAIFTLQLNQVIPDRISGIFQNILTVIFLYSVTLVLARLTASFVTIFGQRTPGVSASLLSNLAKIVVLVLGILMILQTLGISITPILATLGIGGLAVALAFQDTLSNLFSGLYLIISGQVRTGDYVKLETGQEGYVTDITWRNTVIRELPNNLVVVPNTKLASAIFTNYHLPVKEITLPIQVGVSYDSDLEHVEEITVEVAKEVMQELAADISDFEPFILYQNFGEFSINFTVFLRVNEFLNQRIAKHKFIKKLHRRYQQEEITIPFPSREVYVNQKGNNIAND